MSMAKIFMPIRGQLSGQQREPSAPVPAVTAGIAHRKDRVGAQPVTNTPPPGPSTDPVREDAWLARLDGVFDETGWPDA